MLKNFKMFEKLDDVDIITNYIVGLPSGEVIDVSHDEFMILKKNHLIKINQKNDYFNFSDHNYKKIKDLLTKDIATYVQYVHFMTNKFKISNYKINTDLSVDVDGNVDIGNSNLSKIPIKFGKVNGNFDCAINKLTNLVNAPNEVSGLFDCSFNKIYTLIGGPIYANSYVCTDNNLEDLRGFPAYCNKLFDCSRNNINTLDGLPREIQVEFFNVSHNKLRNLSGGCIVSKNFDCSFNSIDSLDNGLKVSYGIFDCSYNKLVNLKNLPACQKIKYNGNRFDAKTVPI